MFRISVTDNTDAIIRQANARRDQMPFAIARALTKTAGLVKEAEYREMRDVFDRPTPFTLNSLFTRPATKSNLSAFVWLKYDASKGTPADKYLNPEIKGGARADKRFERALIGVGAMPAGFRAVPGAACKLDAYGNIDRGVIVSLLSYFKAFPEAGYRANITDKRRASLARGTRKEGVGVTYFAGRPGGGKLPLGIWQRFSFKGGGALKPVLIFVDGALYHALYDFDYVARKTVEREFPGQLRESLAEAMRTAN